MEITSKSYLSPLATPSAAGKDSGRFCAYDDIRDKLIAKGVPADQIAADVTTKKALDLIVDSAKLVEKKAEKKAAKKSTAKKADDKKAEKKPAAKKTAAKKPAAKKTTKKEEDAE